jgi:hypothetical protein
VQSHVKELIDGGVSPVTREPGRAVLCSWDSLRITRDAEHPTRDASSDVTDHITWDLSRCGCDSGWLRGRPGLASRRRLRKAEQSKETENEEI